MKPGKILQFVKILGLLVLVYGAYALFPWGMFAATAESPEGEKLAQQASDPAQKNPDAVVVELFTSQGCSSCPPAEAHQRELALRRDVIALEFHVDYWDDISPGRSGRWKDPFSSPQATLRQSDYNLVLRQTPGGYTPQMVVDGWLQEVGSRRGAVADLIEKAKAGRKTPVTLSPRVDAAGNLTVSVSNQAGGGDAELVYVRLLKRHVTQVQAGENKGEVLASYNIVTRWFAIGLLEEGKREFSKAVPPLSAEETCAVLLQARKSRRILAAAFCGK